LIVTIIDPAVVLYCTVAVTVPAVAVVWCQCEETIMLAADAAV